MNIDRLLAGKGTLTDTPPQQIAGLLREKLNSLELRDQHIESLTTTYDKDGSDIFIFFRNKPRGEDPTVWHTELLLGIGCLHSLSLEQIQALLRRRHDVLKEQYNMPRHHVSLMEFDDRPFLQRVLRPNTPHVGVKDIIICYHPSRGYQNYPILS